MKKSCIFLLVVGLLGLTSCEDIFFEETLSDDPLVLISPAEALETDTSIVNFSWEFVDGATSYQIQIASPDFTMDSHIVVDETTTDNTFSYGLSVGDFVWRVRPIGDSETGNYTTQSFSVIENPDFTQRSLVIIGVDDDLVSNETTYTLSWDPVTDAVLYRIQVLDDTNVVLNTYTTTNTTYDIDLSDGTYLWQIQAEDVNQNLSLIHI